MMKIEEGETIEFGDIKVRAEITATGESVLVVYTDRGTAVVKPRSSNMVIIESTAKSK